MGEKNKLRQKGDKNILGWCVLHYKIVHADKFNSKCRSALKGKRCKHFTYKMPTHLKKRR